MSPTRFSRRAATVLAFVALVAAGCSSGVEDDTTADSTPETTTTTTLGGVLTGTTDVLAGQCFNNVPDPTQQPYAVFVVPCDEPHEFEAYSRTRLELGEPQPPGAPYPGELVVANAAEAQCITGFAAFVGTSWELSEFDLQTWWPSAQSWVQQNDRDILCAIYPVGGGTTSGTARDSKR